MDWRHFQIWSGYLGHFDKCNDLFHTDSSYDEKFLQPELDSISHHWYCLPISRNFEDVLFKVNQIQNIFSFPFYVFYICKVWTSRNNKLVLQDWLNIFKGAILTSATVPWHWLIFCPAPKVSTYIGRALKKRPLESPQIPEVALVVFTPDWRQCTLYLYIITILRLHPSLDLTNKPHQTTFV